MSTIIYTDTKYLTPDTQELAERFIKFLKSHSLSPVVSESYRTIAREEKIYSDIMAGRRKGIPTKHSWHSVGRALDLDITPATVDNILFFLDSARAFGFMTVADPDKARVLLARKATPAEMDKVLFDWHHISYHPNKTWQRAYTEYQELLDRGPKPRPSALAMLSNFVLLGSLVGGIIHYAKKIS
jgi:hypothetical protein